MRIDNGSSSIHSVSCQPDYTKAEPVDPVEFIPLYGLHLAIDRIPKKTS